MPENSEVVAIAAEDAPPREKSQSRGYWLVLSPAAATRPQVKTFVEWLRAAAVVTAPRPSEPEQTR
jgi:hypothetical protein